MPVQMFPFNIYVQKTTSEYLAYVGIRPLNPSDKIIAHDVSLPDSTPELTRVYLSVFPWTFEICYHRDRKILVREELNSTMPAPRVGEVTYILTVIR